MNRTKPTLGGAAGAHHEDASARLVRWLLQSAQGDTSAFRQLHDATRERLQRQQQRLLDQHLVTLCAVYR